MRRWIMVILLVSLGINVGLGIRMFHRESPERPNRSLGRGHQRRDRPDSTHWRKVGDRRLERLVRHLDLSPEQQEIFMAGHRHQGPVLLGQRQKVMKARFQLQEIIAAGKANTHEVRQAINNLGRQEAQLDSLITELILEEMEILEPEQRARYLEILPVFRGHGPDRGSGRRRGHSTP